ncbi:beta-glucosidase 12-like [Pyrus ussuriensis x Pyrus communis]|uniref:Beta-glucosidase 12-like n=1 Tax=Pyrus ussuriensis x Pyrus communis TaxID=2448454 RepID=A0A5N5I2E6_9ROSA|nr:beta-glucosidase 12-like [Pyrus ussuriensis x Pyrus communis]
MAMKYSRSLLFGVLLLIGFALTNSKGTNTDPPVLCEFLNRSSFEPGFIFGSGSASYQYEGAVKEDGRGPSIWDTYTHKHPEKIADGSNGDVAIDQYHRYKEDVGIMKDMELDAYRFSISWSRLLPNGTLSGGVNMKGIDYYNNLINELLQCDHFKDYIELCYKEFPHTFCNMGYALGSYAPGRYSAIEPYLVAHHLLLAHGAALRIVQEQISGSITASQKGLIGITLVSHWFEAASESKQDKDAALRSLDFMFLDPLTTGDYPHTMRSIVGKRLPKFTKEQSKLLNGSLDFLGINYYTARYATSTPKNNSQPASYVTDPQADLTTELNGVLIGPQEKNKFNFFVQ